MIMRIDHIDKISRNLKRDVLWIAFQDKSLIGYSTNWSEPDHPRSKIIEWLNSNDIEWKPCGWYASENGWMGYGGQIYVDIVCDHDDTKFKALSAFLEDENGKVKPEFPNTQFYLTTLEDSMKNAHHDEPGFWEKWAEDF